MVLLPELTRALTANNKHEAQHLQNRSLEFGLGLTIPAAVGLFMLNLPLVALVYERGAFDRETSELTAHVLAGFAIGLPSFVLIKIFQPSFYAREDMKTPMYFSGVNAILNIVLSLTLFPIYGIFGLAIATSTAGWVNALLLWGALYLGNHFNITAMTLRNILLICFASLIMAAILYGGEHWLGDSLTDLGLLSRLGLIGALIAVSAAVYFAMVIATGAISKDQMKRMVKR